MKVLVTGGAGFIGSHLVEALVARGDTVVVLDDLSTGKKGNLAPVWDDIRFVEGSILDEDRVASSMQGCELVFHEAACVSVPRSVEDPLGTEAVNVSGTLHVLRAARRLCVKRLLFAGSSAVFGDNPEVPLDEASDKSPRSPYAVQKLSGESYVQLWCGLYGLETVTLRYFNVFGPRQDPSSPYSGVVSIFVDRLLKGQRPIIYGDGTQTRDFIEVRDVVRANLLAAEGTNASGEIFNIGRNEATSLNALFAMARELTGSTVEAHYAAPRAGDIRHSFTRIEKARSKLGFQPEISVEGGLRRLVQWTKQLGR